MARAHHQSQTLGGVDESFEVLPLTAAQRGMWFAETLSPDYSVNIAQYVDIHHEVGGLDYDLLERCVYDIGRISEFGYIRLAEVDGVPVQYVDFDFDQRVEVLDFRDEPDPAAAAMAWMQAEYRRPVDLLNDQYIVINILKITDERTFWYSRAHHIILDGYAALSMIHRAVDRYNAIRRGEEPKDKPSATMAEIVEYEDAYQRSSRRETDRDHWLARVSDLPERVTLSRAGTSAPLTFDNLVSSQALERSTQARLEALAGELNSSLAVLLTAAFGAYLSRMSDIDDIVMSLPVTGRATAKIKQSGGMVSNVLPIRLRDAQSKTVRELITNAQLELTGALRHQRYRSDDIRRDAGLDANSVSFGPIINMVFFDEQVAIDGTEMEYRILTSGTLEDLLINLYQASPQAPLFIDLHGNPGLYSQDELNALHGRFLQFLEHCLAEDSLDLLVADVPLLTEADERLLASLPEPDTAPEVLRPTLVTRFDEVVAQYADRPAVSDAQGTTLRYRELDAQSDAVAAALRARGVGEGNLVGIATDRDAGLVVAIIGVLKAGAAYLPLDTTNPADRLSFIVEDAAPACVIVSDGERPEWAGASPVVELASLHAGGAGARPRGPATSGASAYVIYTSGSTGAPKGVEIAHRNVMALLDAAGEDFDFAATDVWSVFHSYAFDFSVWELFGPLMSGGRAVIVDRAVARAPAEFLKLLSREKVTVASLTPSAFSILADTRRRGSVPLWLRYIVFGGEELRFDEVDRWYEAFGDRVALVNMYGITETTVHVTFRPLDPELVRDQNASLIGRPLPSLGLRVLDRRLRPVPEGAVGEIYVLGGQLAQGYRNRRELTATRFVAGTDGARMYRTGDLGRRIGDDVQYMGRADTQVQLRGFRVELGEVESALRAVDGVTAAAATVFEAPNSGGAKLIGYVSLEPDSVLDESMIREAVRSHVPGYMVPDIVMLIDELPLTANGKLDHKALPSAKFARDERVAYVAPSTPREIEVVGIVEQVLGVTPIGMQDNIFTLGADSLTAARLASRLRTIAGLEVSLADVFESSTLGDVIRAARPVAAGGVARPPLAPVVRPAQVPLSLSQQRVWFINRLDPASGAYNIPGAVRLGAGVDVDALRRAIEDVVGRHEPLRTTFPDRDGETFQLIHTPEAATAAGVFDVATVTEDELEDRIGEFAVTGFDLATEYPLRARLLRVRGTGGSADDHVLALVMHHIVADGASLGPLIGDVIIAYTARVQNAVPQWHPLPVQFADFSLWQRRVLGEDDDPKSLAARQVSFWREELKGMPELITLPTDRPRPSRPTGAGKYVDTMLDEETVAGLRALAAEHGVTMFAVFHTALAVLLSKLSGANDFAIGTAIAGRDEPELAHLVGMFVNTVVLRTRVEPDSSLESLLDAAHHTRAQALSNADVPFEQIVAAVDARRSRSHSPLFQVELVLQHDQVVHLLDRESTVGLIDARPPFAKYDLSLSVIEFGDTGQHANQIALGFSYAEDLFDRGTIERFARYFHDVLARMTEAVDQRADVSLDSLVRFPDAELDVVRGWSRGADVDVRAAALPELLLAGYATDPTATALVSGDRNVSYAEFGARVNGLTRELIAAGVGPDVAVAVCIPRSVEMLVAIHAIIIASGQYVPVDTEAPADRVEYMLDTARVAVVLIGPGETHPIAAHLGDRATALVVDASSEIDPATGAAAAAERSAALTPDHAAYTIFTSGSTGKPKGVTVSHRAIINRLDWMQRLYQLTPTDVVLQKTPITFDVSVWELLWPFVVGARLVIAEPGRHGDPGYLADTIATERVSTLHFVPSMLSTFADVLGSSRLADLTSVRRLFTSGEALSAATAQDVMSALPAIGLHNLYGPTEAAVDVTEYRVSASDTQVPIGRPVQNTGTYVLDHRLRPLPVGVPGELYLSGVQLARGYASQSRLTAERFVASPFGAPGTRLYRTGDLAVWDAAGRIEYLGRNDFQVKLRGQRLELGEIESALMAVPGVVHAAATVADLAGGQSLVAYYSPATVAPETVRAHIVEHLPEFMVPSIWMPLDAMPVSSAGKVDRRALPEPVVATAPFVGPRTDVEAVIAGVYADVLGAERVSVVESFFDLGGNSLSATKVAARLSAELNVEVPVVAIFDAPSVEAMAELAGQMDTPHRRPPLVPAERGATAPLSSVQRSMWLLNRADPASPVYNLAMALRLTGDLDRSVIQRSIEDLIGRHEALRTKYPMVDGQPMQVVLEPTEALGLIERPVVEAGSDPASVIAEFTGRGFDVTVAPPLRLMLLALAPDEHILVFVVHHISADGSSMLPLATDIMTAYSARVRDAEPGWRPLEVQYADYAVWQRGWLDTVGADDISEEKRQLDYWVTRLANAPAKLELPSDRVRPRTPSFAGGEVTFEVGSDLVRKLDAVARHSNSTVFMVMQAALVVLLSRLTAQHDIVVGTPFAGRGQPQLEGVIGMFVNTLALRTQLQDDEKFAELLQRVRDDDLTDMANADVPFDTIVASVLQSPPTSYNPIYQVMFAYQNFTVPTLDLENLTITPVSEQLTTAKVDLQLTVFPGDAGGFAATGDGSMKGQLIYAADLFTQNTVELYAQRYLRVLEEVSDNPHVLVGDISIATESEAADQRSGARAANGHQLLPLSELVRLAASTVPDEVATSHNGTDVTFAVLSSISDAMAGSLPDADSALTTALMSLIPEVAASGPEMLGEVLGQLRANAAMAVGDAAKNELRTSTSEGMTQT